MKKLISEAELDKKIRQNQILAKKLSKILDQINEKKKPQTVIQRTNLESSKSDQIFASEQRIHRQQTESKLLKNIEKRINIYRHEILKITNLDIQQYIDQIRKLQNQIKDIQQKTIQTNRNIKNLTQILSKQKSKSHDGQFQEFNMFYQQVEALKRKLTKNQRNSESMLKYYQKQKKITNQKMNKNRSESAVKVWDQSSFNHGDQKQKVKIDKQAMYKNLVKYYEGEEKKLKEQIGILQKQRLLQKVNRQEIEKEIKQYEQKIQIQKNKLKSSHNQ